MYVNMKCDKYNKFSSECVNIYNSDSDSMSSDSNEYMKLKDLYICIYSEGKWNDNV